MAQLTLPSLGEGVEKGTVISIMVQVGDFVVLEQSLMEIETDKVVVEIPADAAGIVDDILVNVGDEIIQGAPIIAINEQQEQIDKVVIEPETTAMPEATATAVKEVPIALKTKPDIVVSGQTKKTISLPSLGEGIDKGAVISIMVKQGDHVKAEQALMEVETDKVVVEIPAESDGIIDEILVQVGTEISIGTAIFTFTSSLANEIEEINVEIPENRDTSIEQPEEPPKPIPTIPAPINDHRRSNARASPLAKKFAREIGISIHSVPQKPGKKRITVQDVKDYAKALNQDRASGVVTGNIPLPDFSQWGKVRQEAMPGIMQATSKNMTTSWSQIPHAWLQENVDITYLESKRQDHKASIKAEGGALTITSILVKVVSKALEAFPKFNSSIDLQNASITYKDYVNIGVAVDTERGLLVPVIKNTTAKSIKEIAIELSQSANKVKQKKITAEELEGATFTISNLGGIGTMAIFPLVTFPQVAILGVSASQTSPVLVQGQWQPRSIMPLTIGFDHRVINGADAARFLQHVKNLLEDWFIWNL